MIIRQSRQPAPTSPRGRLLSAAQAAAIEKQRTTYVRLKCGDYTTWDTDQAYSFGRPSKNKSWCEICSKWVEFKIRKGVKYCPDTPMF